MAADAAFTADRLQESRRSLVERKSHKTEDKRLSVDIAALRQLIIWQNALEEYRRRWQ